MLPVIGKILLLLLIGVTLYLFSRRTRFLIKLLGLGKAENRFDQRSERLRYTLGQVLAGRCSLKNVCNGDYAGIGHLILFYAFSLFLISYVFHIAEGFHRRLTPAILGSPFNNFFYFALDVAGLVVIVVIIWAAIRRYIIKPERLEPTLDAGIILMVIFSLMLLNYGMEGFRLLTETEPFAEWLFVGMVFSRFFVHLGVKENSGIYFWIFWCLHIALVFGFTIYVLYSKHLHILASPFNIFFRPMGSNGSLQPIEDFEKSENWGVSRIAEFTWKKLLDLYACTECGRCTANCPASMSGKPLKPNEIIHNLKVHLLTSGKDMLFHKEQGIKERGEEQRSMVGRIVTDDELWACTTCHACIDVCPVEIEHIERIVGLRRHLVMREARFPPEYKKIFKNLEIFGDPFGAGSLTREEWLSGLGIRRVYEDRGIDVLLWVGCTGALYDEKTKSVTVAAAKVLNKAGVRFGILGKKELCCGDPARRMGNEYLFQKLATQNVEIIRKHGIRRLVTFCPHCLNVFRNEYPQFGANFEVVHITEMIRALLENGKLQIKAKADDLFTYHDPCYLGRYNQIYQQPREILEFVVNPTSKEMPLTRERALCCGAGGGNFWSGRTTGRRIEELRIDQAIETSSDGLITACPFCEIMFANAVREKGLEHSFKIMDIVQILDQVT